MKRISLADAIEELSKKYFGYDPVDFFERVRDGKWKGEVDPWALGFCLTEAASLVHEYETASKAKIEKLTSEVEHLRKLLNKNPSNSHKPPSSERNRKIKNSREKTGKPIGAQIGHDGSAHDLHDDADVIHRHDVQKCTECRASLKSVADHEVIRKQTIDIRDGKMHVTEHQTVIKFCPHCGRWNRGDEPKDIQKSRIIFGSNVKSISIYLQVQQLLPLARTQEILFDLFGVPISQGTLCNFLKECGQKLLPWESETKLQLLSSPLNHVDETSIRCEKRGDWIHVICNELLTLLSHHPKRGSEAIDEIGVLPEYKGHLVHDCFSLYWNYGKTHSICNGHILRELKYLSEEQSQKWSGAMSEFLKGKLHELHTGIKRSSKWKENLKTEYIKILKQGYRENHHGREWRGRPPDGYKRGWDPNKKRWIKIPFFRQRSHTKPMNLLNRLRDYEVEVLSFAMKTGIPFTNNQAERDFRMVRLKEKISGCFRSSEMAKSFLRIRSFLSTLRKQNFHPIENLILIDVIDF